MNLEYQKTTLFHCRESTRDKQWMDWTQRVVVRYPAKNRNSQKTHRVMPLELTKPKKEQDPPRLYPQHAPNDATNEADLSLSLSLSLSPSLSVSCRFEMSWNTPTRRMSGSPCPFLVCVVVGCWGPRHGRSICMDHTSISPFPRSDLGFGNCEL